MIRFNIVIFYVGNTEISRMCKLKYFQLDGISVCALTELICLFLYFVRVLPMEYSAEDF